MSTISFAQESSAASDTISAFSRLIPMPKNPLPQPELFPSDRQLYRITLDDTSYVWELPAMNYRVPGFRRVEEVDSLGEYITITAKHHDQTIGIPLRIHYLDYMELRREHNLRRLIRNRIGPGAEEETTSQPDITSSAAGYELLTTEIAGQQVSLRVSGNVNIDARATREDRNLTYTSYRSRPQTNIIFNQRQNFSITGSIADRVNVLVDYNSERDFQFENNVRLNYVGNEDEIIQRIDAGNISLSLPGTQLVTFSPNSQGLFGVRSDLKIGPVDMVAVASIERGRKERVSFRSGSTEQQNEIFDYDYLKNKYFFLSEYYRDNFYPLIPENNLHTTPPEVRKIDDIVLFKSIVGTNTETGTQVWGEAWIDPSDTTSAEAQQEVRRGEFRVAYSTVGGDSVGDLVLTSSESETVDMKLLRIDNPGPGKPTWDLMFKNVYSLGAINLDEDGFELDIIDTYNNQEDNISDDGTPWLQVFGLDRFNSEEQQEPDEQVDIDNIVLLDRGELFIPYLNPFRSEAEAQASGEATPAGRYNPNLEAELSQTEMYEGSYRRNKDIYDESRFKLVVTSSSQSSNINLGFNIIEGSEEVRADGRTLTRGQDYTIDYFIGEVSIINDEYLQPGVDLEVLYESNEIFQLDKKVIMGGRAEYAFGQNSFLAATGMFYSKTSADDKVRVGQEPFQNFVWDVNGRWQSDLDFLTRAVDKLPLFRTETTSRIQLEGEFAQVLPNPNIQNSNVDKRGVAYIDDFEGSKRTTSLTVSKYSWKKSSVPRRPNGESLGYSELNRGHLFWYNPYIEIPTSQIWPNRETNYQLQNDQTQVLHVVLDPSKVVGDQEPVPSDSIWGGFMRALPSSYRDQSDSKFIELWVKGSSGTMHIDLGLVSEDANSDGRLNNEDIRRGGILNNILDEGEDVGLDGLLDEDEIGVYGPGGIDTLTIDSPPAMFEKYGLQDGDPTGDNYDYSRSDFTTYRYSNGTQGNGSELGQNFPDSEDLNRNNILDRTESYFSYTVSLDTVDNQYFVNETVFDDGTGTGWKQYLIPLSDFDPEMSDPQALINDVRYARIWFTDFDYNAGNEDTISIAKMEIVGNDWQEAGVQNVFDGDSTSVIDSSFTVSVVNNEDNNAIYRSPEGVTGAEDRVYGITSKEQSLVLRTNAFRKGSQGLASRNLQNQNLNLVNYRYLKMFFHGDQANPPGTHMEFFFRMGLGEEDYYEYRSQIEPGWQQMELDMDFLAQLKAVDSLTVSPGSPFPSGNPKGRIYYEPNSIVFVDTTGETTKELVVHGQPSAGKIKEMVVGLRNFNGRDYRDFKADDTPPIEMWNNYTGDVWVNELRATGVSRTGGTAMRARASLQIADLMDIQMSTNRVDADFHRVDNQWGNDQNTESYGLNASLNSHKVFPEAWGLRIPVWVRLNETRQVPKYLPGSDILTDRLYETLTESAAEDTITKIERYSIQRSYGTSFSKTSRSDFWLLRYLVDPVQFSYDVSKSFARDNQQKYNTRSNNVLRAGYNLQLIRGNGIPIFGFLESLPLIGEQLSQARFHYKPTRISVSGALSEQKQNRAYRTSSKDPTNTYNQELERTFGIGYDPFQSMNFSFSKRMDSNVSQYRGPQRWDMIKYFKPGIVTRVNETYRAGFNPEIADWLRQSVQYESGYQYENSLNIEKTGVDTRYSQQTTYSNQGSGQRPTGQTRPGARPSTNPQTQPGEAGEEDSQSNQEGGGFEALGQALRSIVEKLQPINLTFTNRRNGQHNNLVHAPGVLYRLGWQVDAEVPVDSAYITQENSRIDISRNLTARTGYNFTDNMTASFNFGYTNSRSFGGLKTAKNISYSYLLFQFRPEDYDLSKNHLVGFPIPSWSIRWNGLERWAIFENIANSVTLNHSFQGEYSTTYRDGKQYSAGYSQNMRPLLGIQITFKNNITTNMSYGASKRVTANYASASSEAIDVTNSNNISLSGSYQHRGGLRIPLPFISNLNLNNNISTSLTFDYSSSERLRNQTGEEFTTYGKSYSWNIRPQMDYSFTNTVTGGVYYQYGKRYNKSTNTKGKPTTSSDFGLTINIQIRGR